MKSRILEKEELVDLLCIFLYSSSHTIKSYDKGKYTYFNSTWINYLAEYAEAFDYNEMPQCDDLRIPTTFPRF